MSVVDSPDEAVLRLMVSTTAGPVEADQFSGA
jgi:hypothetical protein